MYHQFFLMALFFLLQWLCEWKSQDTLKRQYQFKGWFLALCSRYGLFPLVGVDWGFFFSPFGFLRFAIGVDDFRLMIVNGASRLFWLPMDYFVKWSISQGVPHMFWRYIFQLFVMIIAFGNHVLSFERSFKVFGSRLGFHFVIDLLEQSFLLCCQLLVFGNALLVMVCCYC